MLPTQRVAVAVAYAWNIIHCSWSQCFRMLALPRRDLQHFEWCVPWPELCTSGVLWYACTCVVNGYGQTPINYPRT